MPVDAIMAAVMKAALDSDRATKADGHGSMQELRAGRKTRNGAAPDDQTGRHADGGEPLPRWSSRRQRPRERVEGAPGGRSIQIRERHNPAILERNVDGNGCWTLCLMECSMIMFEGF